MNKPLALTKAGSLKQNVVLAKMSEQSEAEKNAADANGNVYDDEVSLCMFLHSRIEKCVLILVLILTNLIFFFFF